MRNISIHFVPHYRQRYDSVGDYYEKNGHLRFNISQLKDERHEFLVAIHELIEWYLCTDRGIALIDIDKFDLQYKGDGEAGDDPGAPYRKEHQFATQVERLLAKELGVNWEEYDLAINNLSKLWTTKHNKMARPKRPKRPKRPSPKKPILKCRPKRKTPRKRSNSWKN